MARVPVIQGNSVQLRPTTEARFRAADNDGGIAGGIGRGLQGLGAAVSDYAEQQERINELFDETAARKLDNEATARVREMLWTGDDAYFSKRGFDAANARPVVEKNLQTIRSEMLAKATSERQKRMFGDIFDRRSGAELEGVARHAIGQIQEEGKRQSAARMTGFADDAVRHAADPEQFAVNLQGGLSELRNQGDLEGWSSEALTAAEEKFVSGVHASIVDRYLAEDDVGAADAHFQKNRGKMTASEEAEIAARLKGPMQTRQAASDFAEATALPSLDPDRKGSDGKKMPVADGGDVITALFPKARVTQVRRDPNSALGKANPRSWHNRTGAAVDVAPIAGMSFQDYIKGIEDAGYSIIEAKNEVGAGRSAHATGDHWHVVIGQRGENPAPMQSSRRWDKEDVFARIDKQADAQGWTFERRERAKDYASGQIARDEQLLDRREAEADRLASEFILKKGDAFTDVAQIPRSVWAGMSVSQRATATNLAKHNSTGTSVKPNSNEAMTLSVIAASDPERFAALDLTPYASKVSRAELEGFLVQQAKLRSGVGEKIVKTRTDISGTIDFFAKADEALGKALDRKKNPESYMRVFNDMNGTIQAITGGKREPTDAELKAAFDKATMKVTAISDGWFGENRDERFRFQLDGGEGRIEAQVPVAIRDRIVSSYKRANNGAEPPPGLVGAIYIRQRGKPGFWN